MVIPEKYPEILALANKLGYEGKSKKTPDLVKFIEENNTNNDIVEPVVEPVVESVVVKTPTVKTEVAKAKGLILNQDVYFEDGLKKKGDKISKEESTKVPSTWYD